MSPKQITKNLTQQSPIIYFDGLPGLGKSTAGVSLARDDENLVFIAENNPSAADYPAVVEFGGVEAARWYMRTEIKRSHYAGKIADEYRVRAVCDKSVLATLAFVYAATRVGWEPASTYDRVRAEYLRDIRDQLPADATTVLFSGSVSLSVSRRADKPDRSMRPFWFDPAFLEAQADFLQHEAPALCPNRLVSLDATGSRQALLEAAAELIHSPRTRRDFRSPPGIDPTLEPNRPHIIDKYVSARGGTAVFGSPIGRPFRQFGLLSQAFDRHLVVVGPGGEIAVQRDAWDDSLPPSTFFEN